MESFSAGWGLAVSEWVCEVGDGMNFRRRKFVPRLDQVIAGEVSMIVLAHRDGLARFGFELIEWLAWSPAADPLHHRGGGPELW
jgi:putative resolvase